jgi:hypothetical protein
MKTFPSLLVLVVRQLGSNLYYCLLKLMWMTIGRNLVMILLCSGWRVLKIIFTSGDSKYLSCFFPLPHCIREYIFFRLYSLHSKPTLQPIVIHINNKRQGLAGIQKSLVASPPRALVIFSIDLLMKFCKKCVIVNLMLTLKPDHINNPKVNNAYIYFSCDLSIQFQYIVLQINSIIYMTILLGVVLVRSTPTAFHNIVVDDSELGYTYRFLNYYFVFFPSKPTRAFADHKKQFVLDSALSGIRNQELGIRNPSHLQLAKGWAQPKKRRTTKKKYFKKINIYCVVIREK